MHVNFTSQFPNDVDSKYNSKLLVCCRDGAGAGRLFVADTNAITPNQQRRRPNWAHPMRGRECLALFKQLVQTRSPARVPTHTGEIPDVYLYSNSRNSNLVRSAGF